MFAQPETWVAIAFVILFALFAYLGIHKTVLTALDHRAQRIKAELDDANAKYARVEQIKRFRVLERDFTLEAGELTPSLKLKRNVVYVNYADDFEALYD